MTLNDYLIANPNLSDAEAAAGYNAQPPVTARAVKLVDLAAYLNKNGLLVKLEMIAANPDTPMPTAVGLTSFVRHLNDVRQTNLDTTEPAIATTTSQILGGLRAMQQIEAEQVAAIYALGGGLVRPTPVTADDVTAVRALIARKAAVAVERAKVTTYLNEVLNPAESNPALPLVTPEEHFGA